MYVAVVHREDGSTVEHEVAEGTVTVTPSEGTIIIEMEEGDMVTYPLSHYSVQVTA